MQFEPWMLLIFPLFFGLGWLAARLDVKQLLSESQALPQSYFQGLNFLLNEQQDKAIEAFIEVVKVDPQTVELHFALGSLFRRRGEIDRALRMHHNLVDRADLDRDKRRQAVFELAQDYLKAGIFDRAESLFRELLKTPHEQAALGFLLELFQKEKDWKKAIDIALRLDKIADRPYHKHAALFHCELAQQALDAGQDEQARQHLQDALAIDPASVRASMLQGDMAEAAQDHAGAIAHWQRIEQQDAHYLPLVAERLIKAHAAQGQEEAGALLLRRYMDAHPALDLMNALFESVLRREGAAAAYRLVRDELRRTPSLLGLDKLLEASLSEVSEARRQDVELVRDLIHRRTRDLAMYHCAHCGFKARQFYWHCPACHSWDTYSPRHNEEDHIQP